MSPSPGDAAELGTTSPIAVRSSPGSPGIPSPRALPAEPRCLFGHVPQPPHELIERHRRKAISNAGAVPDKPSPPPPSHGMVTAHNAAPRQRAPAHPSAGEHHSYPPQPCLCQMPRPSPLSSSLDAAVPAAPRGAGVINGSVNEDRSPPAPQALPWDFLPVASPRPARCLLFPPYNSFKLHLLQLRHSFRRQRVRQLLHESL